jgi:TRAP-type C4-dicarboxylate transport system permease large subunit
MAIAGSLAIMIPPSIVMVIYSILANASLGAVMIAGIIPGFVLTGLIMLYVLIRVTINPELAPISEDRYTTKEKLKSLVGMAPIGVLFIAIIGGMFFGLWDAIEASAVGVFVALIICIIYFRVLSWQALKRALIGSVKTSTMIYMLIVGGNILAYVFYITGLQKMIERAGIEAKMPFKVHPHMLRHATGYALANKGTDTRTLQAYLGHRSIQSTVRYTELAPGRFKNLWR